MTYKVCWKCKENKGTELFYAHKSRPDGKATMCKACEKVRGKERYVANKVHFTELSKQWYQNNKEKAHEHKRTWVKNNKEKHAVSTSKWDKANKDKKAAIRAKRRALKKNATPIWLTDAQNTEIQSFYTKAKRLTIETGIKHEVDHIEPITGLTSIGLHVPWNLQVITMSENRSKYNKLIA